MIESTPGYSENMTPDPNGGHFAHCLHGSDKEITRWLRFRIEAD
jgi:hypothetical protein